MYFINFYSIDLKFEWCIEVINFEFLLKKYYLLGII
ncbi:hypothetical protein BN3590_01356 [Clostridium sp. C105KSO15]|nr:hypothetical protein BN3590_01356 [Clostridium sp. C105KSO15]